MRGRPTPSLPGGLWAQTALWLKIACVPQSPGARVGSQRRPSDPVCACPPSPLRSPPQRRSHLGADLASRWSSGVYRPRAGVGVGGGQRRGTQDTPPRVGPGRSARDPPSLLAPSRSTGTAASTRQMGGHSASLKPQRGPASQSQGSPRLGSLAEQRVPRAPTV